MADPYEVASGLDDNARGWLLASTADQVFFNAALLPKSTMAMVKNLVFLGILEIRILPDNETILAKTQFGLEVISSLRAEIRVRRALSD